MFLKVSGIIAVVLSSWSLSPSSSSSCMRPDPAPWSAGCLPDCLIWNGQRGAALIITLMGAFGKKDFEFSFVMRVCQCIGVLVWLFATLAMCESVPSSSPCWGLFEISNLPLFFLSVVLCDCTCLSLFLKGFLYGMIFVHKEGDPNLCPIGLRCALVLILQY